MNRTKKLVSVLLTVLLLLSSTAAMAASITVGGGNAGASYNAYQIMTVTTSGTANYGYKVNSAYVSVLVELLNIDTTGKNDVKVNNEIVATIGELDTVGMRELADDLYRKIQAGTFTVDKTLSAGSNDVDPGYWLVVDVTENPGEGKSRAIAALVTLSSRDTAVDIAPKLSSPTVEKKVSDAANGTFGDYVDVNIGDIVYFKITATLPANLSSYEQYKLVFHDTLSTGLSYVEDSAVVTINGSNMTSKFTVTPPPTATGDDCNLHVSIADLLDETDGVTGVDAEDEIVLTYSAKLNTGAVIGNPGNPNTVYLEYSNDPYHQGTGDPSTGETPKDKVYVFTFQLDVDKYDAANAETKLENAKFKLYRKSGSDTQYAKLDAAGKVIDWKDTEAEGTEFATDENGKASVTGLEEGTYYLVETGTPDGFNQLEEPIEFTITATYDTSGDEVVVETLEITTGGETTGGNVDTGIVTIGVANQAGTILPGTGGMGTTLFIIAGVAIMALAAVLLIAKKRRSNA